MPLFNVLITSISKKIPLIEAVRQAIQELNLTGNVIGADNNPQAIGRYFVDSFWKMPLLNDLMIDQLIDYCRQHDIKAIIPTRDGELPFFSRNRDALQQEGIACMISSIETIEICLDKLAFFFKLSQAEFPVIATYEQLKEMTENTYVVKERYGAGARNIGLNLSAKEAKEQSQRLQHPVFQPYIEGIEYSIDLYLDQHQKALGSIVRTRDLIVDGESQVTTSIDKPDIADLCLNAARYLKIQGHAVFQVLEDSNHRLHIIECNPRFGGASTVSIAMGLTSFKWFFQEYLKQPLTPFKRASSEMKQIRYTKDKVILL
jgi:carbamoyl-phosphate synthase large subunit